MQVGSADDPDFLLISEFSELVGPVCLQTLPNNGANGFDVSRFVLKIMSVDHQAKGESGVFGEDAQMVFFEPLENAWFYVHHLTLLDINARGYVRPICFSYCTRDNHKITANFQKMLRHFTEVSNVLKTGNYELFRDDLKKRMADLAYTKGVVDNVTGASMITAATPGIISRHFEDMKQMRDKMKKAAPTGVEMAKSPDLAIDLDLNQLKAKNATRSRRTSVAPQERTEDDDDFRGEFFNAEAGLETDEQEEAEEQEENDDDEEEESQEDHLGEIMVNIVKALGIDKDYKPRVIQSLHKSRTLSSSLRSLRELCGAHYEQAMSKLEQILQHFSRCTMELSLEAEELSCLQPVSSALVVGGVPVLNFNWQADRCLSKVVHNLHYATTSASETSEDDYDFRSFTAGGNEMHHLSSEMVDQTMAYAHGLVMGRGMGGQSLPGKHLLVDQSARAGQTVQLRTVPELLPLASSAPFVDTNLTRCSFPLHGVGSLMSNKSDTQPATDALALRRFSFSKHALFSLLKGRPLIVYGQNQEEVKDLVDVYSLLVVCTWGKNAVEPWLGRQPRISDLAKFSLIGLSKSHKIPSTVAHYVSVLDLDNATLDAPGYDNNGRLLSGICDPSRVWKSNQTYLAFIYAEISEIATIACLYFYCCNVGVPYASGTGEEGDEKLLQNNRFSSSPVGTTFRKSIAFQFSAPLMEQSPALFCKEHRLSPCDHLIVENVCECMKKQQAQELYDAGCNIKLDYSKVDHFVDHYAAGSSGSLRSPPKSGTPSRVNSTTNTSPISASSASRQLFK